MEQTFETLKTSLYRAHHRAMALLTTHGKTHSEICEMLVREGYHPVIVSLVTTEQGLPESSGNKSDSQSFFAWAAEEFIWEIVKGL